MRRTERRCNRCGGYRELVAAPGVVDPDDDTPDARRAEEGEQVLGFVSHQDADVERQARSP